MTNLRQAEPVSHAVIAGALFDFMGWLTSRKERLVLSSADEAGPAVEAITEFSKMRGLSLDDAKVQDWQDYTAPPQQQAEPPPEWPLIKNILAEYGLGAISFVAEFKAAQRPWVDLTDGDWEWVADKKETSLDTFAHGAAWAADQLKEKNT